MTNPTQSTPTTDDIMMDQLRKLERSLKSLRFTLLALMGLAGLCLVVYLIGVNKTLMIAGVILLAGGAIWLFRRVAPRIRGRKVTDEEIGSHPLWNDASFETWVGKLQDGSTRDPKQLDIDYLNHVVDVIKEERRQPQRRSVPPRNTATTEESSK